MVIGGWRGGACFSWNGFGVCWTVSIGFGLGGQLKRLGGFQRRMRKSGCRGAGGVSYHGHGDELVQSYSQP